MAWLGLVLEALVKGLVAWFKPDPAERAGGLAQHIREMEAENELDAKAMAARDAASGAAPGKLRDGSVDPDCRDC